MARWPALTAAGSEVMDRIQDLSLWRRLDVQRPRSLSDILRPGTALRFVLDPQMAVSVCRALNLDPADVFRREIRPDRMLPNLNTLDLTLTDRIHAVPAAKIVQLLQEYPDVKLFVTRGRKTEIALRPSIISLLMMGIRDGETVTFRAEGYDSLEVLRRLREYNETGWFRRRGEVKAEIYKVKGKTPQEVAQEVSLAMDRFGAREISGIFHTQTRQLFIGWLIDGHKQIADAAGFPNPNTYSRINFDGRKKGEISAYFPGELSGENLLGRLLLRKWLAELFFRKHSP